MGGHAIACERGDRSANFLASLPFTKGQIITSKLVVAGLATAVLWGWVLSSLYIVAPSPGSDLVDSQGTMMAPGGACVCVLTFGIGWLASASMEKTILPIIMALASPVAVSVMLLLVGVALGIPKIRVSGWSSTVCLVIGAVAFLTGTWTYCRRVEP